VNANVHTPRSDNRLRDGLDSAVHGATVDLLSRSRAVGLAIGVFSADGTVRTYGYGSTSLARAALPTPHTRYAIASITKTFTATLLAQAVVRGRLRLDDDVRRYLPGEYPNLAFAGHPIRLSHLITHLSGLPRNFPDSAIPASTADRDRFYRELHRAVLDTIPGARLSYSNAGAQLLGFILERVYEQPLETLLAARITRPLEMRETKIGLTPSERAQMARGYDSPARRSIRRDSRRCRRRVRSPPPSPTWSATSSGTPPSATRPSGSPTSRASRWAAMPRGSTGR
jgi:CubicO group peptidase (beta-lactamase class C family)